jgi:hypothetical protein
VLGQHSFSSVTGSAKVSQDIAVATLEPFGCDRFHPGWGSILGTLVGTPSYPTAPQTVYTEVSRLVSNYIATQTATANLYSSQGSPTPYSSADLATGIVSWQTTQATTSVSASFDIGTVAGTPVTVTAASS